jgi:hypothetical protein
MQKSENNMGRFYAVVISSLLVWFAELAIMALVH